MPQHFLGLEGMPRRVYTYSNESWEGYNLASTIGSYVMGIAILLFIVNVLADDEPRRTRRQRPVAGGHARVVHDLTAAAAQLRRGAVRDERETALRPAKEAA